MSVNEYKEQAGRWVTVGGKKIFIKDGEKPQEAFDRTFYGKKKETIIYSLKHKHPNSDDIDYKNLKKRIKRKLLTMTTLRKQKLIKSY